MPQAVSNFSHPEHDCYRLMVNEELAGFLVLILNGMFAGGSIKSLMVSSHYRGLGLGKRLWEFEENKIFQEFDNAYLCVSSFNKKAFNWYIAAGFKQVGSLEALIVPEYDELLMRKRKL